MITFVAVVDGATKPDCDYCSSTCATLSVGSRSWSPKIWNRLETHTRSCIFFFFHVCFVFNFRNVKSRCQESVYLSWYCFKLWNFGCVASKSRFCHRKICSFSQIYTPAGILWENRLSILPEAFLLQSTLVRNTNVCFHCGFNKTK